MVGLSDALVTGSTEAHTCESLIKYLGVDAERLLRGHCNSAVGRELLLLRR